MDEGGRSTFEAAGQGRRPGFQARGEGRRPGFEPAGEGGRAFEARGEGHPAFEAAGEGRPEAEAADRGHALQAENLTVWYGSNRAVRGIDLRVPRQQITALIGPSGSGKSTILRCFNRMNDLIPGARIEGGVRLGEEDIYRPDVDPAEVRRRVGMVFQRPNPFPKSVFENVAWGARINGYRGNLADLVEQSLRRAALWDEVKDDLKRNALNLSGGQQQRLCIARALAIEPEVILMDEPASALDPTATLKIEDLMRDLSEAYTILIVTHNMQQAARVSDWTAVLMTDETRVGELIEWGQTKEIFTRPQDPRTEDYITGRIG